MVQYTASDHLAVLGVVLVGHQAGTVMQVLLRAFNAHMLAYDTPETLMCLNTTT